MERFSKNSFFRWPLTVIIALLSSSVQAEYTPFVYEGRSWEVATAHYSGLYVHPLLWDYTYSTYSFEGDTVIGGHHCLNMYMDDDAHKVFVASFYEEEKKVYWFPTTETTDGRLLYDFSLEKGDILSIASDSFLPMNYIIKESRDDSVDGNKVHIQYLAEEGNDEIRLSYGILEGIGSLQGPLGILSWGQTGTHPKFLVKCAVDDNVVFSRDLTPKVEDYLQEVPYLFEGDGNLYDDQEIWLLINWDYMPFAPEYTSYSSFTQQVDSIVGNTVYVSHHFNSSRDFTNFFFYDYGKYLKIGRLSVGEYSMILSAVDDDGQISLLSYEIPFTVVSNTEKKKNGLLHFFGDEHDRDDQRVTDLIAWYDRNEGNLLHIGGFMCFDSQMEHYCSYSVQGDTIFLTAKQTGAYSTDKGYFRVDFMLDGFCEDCCVLIVNDESGSNTYVFKLTSIPFIEENKTIFNEIDLQGRPADGTRKGILICNGKKVRY